jgi:hypothetical protein
VISQRAKDLVLALHEVQDVHLRWEIVQQALDDEREDMAAAMLLSKGDGL